MNKSHSLTVYSTNDYTLFKKVTGNRDVNDTHVKQLQRIIKVKPTFTERHPIIVNEDMFCIDGQHRVAAYQKHQEETGVALPIWFIVQEGLTVNDARDFNAAAKPWTPMDYAEFYANAGNTNYATYIKFVRKYALNNQVVTRFLSPTGGYELETFRSGEFRVANEAQAHRLCSDLHSLAILGLEKEFYAHRSFALSFLILALTKGFDFERLIDQFKAYPKFLKDVPLRNSEMTIALFQLYNKGQEEKLVN